MTFRAEESNALSSSTVILGISGATKVGTVALSPLINGSGVGDGRT
jgi:hypothetical protein